MEKLTYKALTERLGELTDLKTLYDSLVACGIPQGKAHYYVRNLCSSGYSMGEIVEVWCNGKLIDRVNNTKEYAKSCSWRAKHGLVVLNFTKKALRRLIDINIGLEHASRTENHSDYTRLYYERRDLVRNAFVAKKSVVKELKLW